MHNEHQTLPTFLRPNQLSFAISAVLVAPAAAVAQDQQNKDEGLLEEVLVTATKRTESMQDLPQSIQALSEQMLKAAGIEGMDDYARFIPSMSYAATNPGVAKLVFRGISDDVATFIAEPSAALYLDEQSLTMTGTPNPRLVDIERVEALVGPQGTLYGASSQSGTLRIITNKPDPSQWEANIDLMYKGMSEGDSSYDATAVLNIPLSDTAAIRLVGFTAEDGGFIDNVFGTHPRFGIKDNAGTEIDDFNSIDWDGGRIAARWFPNEDWTVDLAYAYQSMYAKGRPEMDPTVGDLQVVRFVPDKEYNDNEWSQIALTLEGDLGFANFVSATSFFERDWEYAQDTSAYASYFGTFCYAPYYDNWDIYYSWIIYTRYCFQPAELLANDYFGVYYNEPVGWLNNISNDKKFSQEFRLSGQTGKLDWVAGVFYEKHKERWDFFTRAFGYADSVSAENYRNGYLSSDYGDRGNPQFNPTTDIWWISRDRTTREQKSVFGEVTIHINEQWDATIGARWFDRTIDKIYWVELPGGNITDEGFLTPNGEDSDVVPKFSLKYSWDDNKMVYALYSEGFRPGGTNRDRGIPFFPKNYNSDYVDNIEFGGKFTLNGGRTRLNLTYFDMSWNDYQLEVVDPSNVPCGEDNALPEPNCGQPWQKVVANVGNASSQGFEIQLDHVANQNVTIGFNAAWLDSTLDEEVSLSDPFSTYPAGIRLPLSPEFKASGHVDIHWPTQLFGAEEAYVRFQASYTDDMLNVFEPLSVPDTPAPQLVQPSYAIADLKFGLTGADWSVQFFVNNLTDERAVLFDNPYEFDRFFGHGRQTVNRPREIGLRYTKSWTK